MVEMAQPQERQYDSPRHGDQNWARMQPIHLVPDAARLGKPHSVVTISNISDREGRPQVHIIVDRHQNGVELQPGQSRTGVEMLNDDIEYFRRQRQGGRKNPATGQLLPPIPILIDDVKPLPDLRAADPTIEAKAEEAAKQPKAEEPAVTDGSEGPLVPQRKRKE